MTMRPTKARHPHHRRSLRVDVPQNAILEHWNIVCCIQCEPVHMCSWVPRRIRPPSTVTNPLTVNKSGEPLNIFFCMLHGSTKSLFERSPFYQLPKKHKVLRYSSCFINGYPKFAVYFCQPRRWCPNFDRLAQFEGIVEHTYILPMKERSFLS